MTAAPVGESIAGVPVVSWDEFCASFRWEQGEHVAVIGPTGMGKTNLITFLVTFRQWVVMLTTKPRDPNVKRLGRKGWRIIRAWPPGDETVRKVVLWPAMTSLSRSESGRVAEIVRRALGSIFQAGGWCLVMDDAEGLIRTLGVGHEVMRLWNDGRSVGISNVLATQRPAWVPVAVWANLTHLFAGQTTTRDDLRKISGFGFVDAEQVRTVVRQLGRHQFLYANARTGQMLVSQAPAPSGRR